MKEEKTVYYSIVKRTNIKVNDNIEKNETKQAKIILKKMLDYLEKNIPEIYISLNGKPYFKDSNIYFNYSHSKNYIACAISYYEIGIDIEETTRKINDDIAKKYLDNVIGNEKRIETWVKKESYSKLKGLGLQMKFQNIKLDKIKTKNLFISGKDYMCSIYCDNDDVEFKELGFNGSQLL